LGGSGKNNIVSLKLLFIEGSVPKETR